MQPKVLLLDEPLSAIDAKLRKSLQTSIRRIHKDLGLTSVFVTHDQDEAMVMSDVIHLFHDGVIEQSGSPVEVYTKPETTFAAGFIGNYNILDANAMEAITGKKWNSGQFAIRPETFLLSKERSLTMCQEEMCSATILISMAWKCMQTCCSGVCLCLMWVRRSM